MLRRWAVRAAELLVCPGADLGYAGQRTTGMAGRDAGRDLASVVEVQADGNCPAAMSPVSATCSTVCLPC